MSKDIVVHCLSGSDIITRIDELTNVLVDCVEGGASVSFMLPLSRTTANQFWTRMAEEVQQNKRMLFVAEKDDGSIVGTVQLILAMPENQPHRGEIAKLLVHHRARCTGVGQRLMEAAEEAARGHGRSVLVLDTSSSTAERLYRRLGWKSAGVVPNYAFLPHGELCSTTFYYKQL